ncbi:hypothetical protein KDA_46870 [Dictyobacter alpinus]|uniref:Uncharacterized protein n=1 Tax=Dictyobacter alpinus TaxID=2014873 RepID=A0A402BCU3_9CHLR|nr:hypothetical protein KDA_46870 [Dictyobacter alpinus]
MRKSQAGVLEVALIDPARRFFVQECVSWVPFLRQAPSIYPASRHLLSDMLLSGAMMSGGVSAW